MLCADASGAIGAAGAQRVQCGASPKTHRAIPAVTQGQTGQPRADSTAPNPERRCGCGTRHDLRDNVGANDRFFSRSRLPEAKAGREPLPRLRPFTCVRPQAEPTRGPEPPPATRNRSRAPSLACHNGTAPVARSVISHRRTRPHSPADAPSHQEALRPREGGDLGVLTEPQRKPLGAPAFAGEQRRNISRKAAKTRRWCAMRRSRDLLQTPFEWQGRPAALTTSSRLCVFA